MKIPKVFGPVGCITGMGITEAFNQFRTVTGDDVSAAILAVGSVLAGQQTDDRPLTVKEAKEFLNVSADTVYSLCDSDQLKHHKIGNGRGTIRIMLSDLIEFRKRRAA